MQDSKNPGRVKKSYSTLPGWAAFTQVIQAMMVLTGAGHVCAAQEDAVINK